MQREISVKNGTLDKSTCANSRNDHNKRYNRIKNGLDLLD